jgi:hypothetical protein
MADRAHAGKTEQYGVRKSGPAHRSSAAAVVANNIGPHRISTAASADD